MRLYIIVLLYILNKPFDTYYKPAKLSRCAEDYNKYYPNLFKGVVLRNGTNKNYNSVNR